MNFPVRRNSSGEKMNVVKKDGRKERENCLKIRVRIKKMTYGLSSEHCDPVLVSRQACGRAYDGVTTSQLDEFAAGTSLEFTRNHPDYAYVSQSFKLQVATFLLILVGFIGIYIRVWIVKFL